MKFSKNILAQSIIDLCFKKNIKNIVISPGSRNAPLTLGFNHNSFFKTYNIVDERSAAFFALGIAQQINFPVVLVCTSGSALLNYYPAISEAYYSNIPLVILSADRPGRLLNIGDGQTINQKNVFNKNIGYSENLNQNDNYYL
ncbi:thiamine pyrophosphate-binding protein, partial [Flavobacteriaceae bacterium]|nr:thiamine pyrophosphate-binding protein [Flavobacteriaceae bacterium]